MGAFVIVLREAFEACLIVGLIMAVLAKTGGSPTHRRSVWVGVGTAVAVSSLVGAALFALVGELHGRAEGAFEGVAMLLACVVLTWMVFWMRAQARTIGGHLRARVGEAMIAGGGLALAAVAFVGVAREGLETALFVFVSSKDEGVLPTVVGGGLGLVAAVAAGIAFYRGALRLDLRKFFLVTGLLVIGLGAYLLHGGLHGLGEATRAHALESASIPMALLFAAAFAWLLLRDALPAQRPA